MSRQDLVDQLRAQVEALGPASSELDGEVREDLFRAVVAQLPDDVATTLSADQAGALAFPSLPAATDLAAASGTAPMPTAPPAGLRAAELERSQRARGKAARPPRRTRHDRRGAGRRAACGVAPGGGQPLRALRLPDGSRLLHIGPHKTGTTTVQAALHQSRAALAEHGVHLAGSNAHPIQPPWPPSGQRTPDVAGHRWRGPAGASSSTR